MLAGQKPDTNLPIHDTSFFQGSQPSAGFLQFVGKNSAIRRKKLCKSSERTPEIVGKNSTIRRKEFHNSSESTPQIVRKNSTICLKELRKSSERTPQFVGKNSANRRKELYICWQEHIVNENLKICILNRRKNSTMFKTLSIILDYNQQESTNMAVA